tara:strand:+ start:334 stop:636 length:303 start_codon:yes stop_codon:yes gene_type:complete
MTGKGTAIKHTEAIHKNFFRLSTFYLLSNVCFGLYCSKPFCNTDNPELKNATSNNSIIFASMIPDEFAKYKEIADCNPVLKALDKINFQYSLFFTILLPS